MGNRLFTDEQDAYFREIIKGKTCSEAAEAMNEKFRLNITAKKIRCYKSNHRITSGCDTKFKKSNKPWNKGKQCPSRGNTILTQFKKGNIPWNHRPIGSERVSVDGYIEIKVAEPNKWKLKHRVVWEEANGPLQKGQKIVFLNKNKQDLRLENLEVVDDNTMLRLNQKKRLSNNQDISRVAVNITKLENKIIEKEKKR